MNMTTRVSATFRRFEAYHVDPTAVRPLAETHRAVTSARTVYPSTVVDVADSPRLLVSGRNSRKIGREVRKGPWKGMPVYTLTLEERASCPTSCALWRSCYGNNMHYARRHRHGPELIARLQTEVAVLSAAHRRGFVVRLHVLGDFWSPDYVESWAALMDRYPRLHVFGYTARGQTDPIGAAVERLNYRLPERWQVLFSVAADADPHVRQAITVKSVEEATAAGAVVCPAQLGKTEGCGTCGLCWNPAFTITHRIAFLLHGNGRDKLAGRATMEKVGKNRVVREPARRRAPIHVEPVAPDREMVIAEKRIKREITLQRFGKKELKREMPPLTTWEKPRSMPVGWLEAVSR